MKLNNFCFVKDFPKLFINRRKQKTLNKDVYYFYRPVLFVFLCFGIDVLPHASSFKCLRATLVNLNYILTFITFITGIGLVASMESLSPITLAPLCVLVAGFLLKCLLIRKRKCILHLLKLLGNNNLPKRAILELRENRMVLLTLPPTILCQTLLLCLSVPYSTGKQLRMNSMSLLIHIENIFKIDITDYMLYIESTINFVVPFYHIAPTFSAFVMLYTLLACHLKVLATNILTEINRARLTFPQISTLYDQVYRLTETVNATLGSVCVVAVLFVSSYLYFSIFILMQAGMKLDYMNVLCAIPVLGMMAQLFFMIKVSSDVTDINKMIQNAILHRPHDWTCESDKLFLFMKTQQGLGLSLGGYVSIERGLIFTLVGTILTYSMLIKSFPI